MIYIFRVASRPPAQVGARRASVAGAAPPPAVISSQRYIRPRCTHHLREGLLWSTTFYTLGCVSMALLLGLGLPGAALAERRIAASCRPDLAKEKENVKTGLG